MPTVQTELYNPVTGIRLRETGNPEAGPAAELVWEATYPPHATEPPPHFHPFQSERMEVLSGALSARVSGTVRLLQPGDAVEIPAGAPHATWTPAAEPVTVVWRVMPARRRREFFARLYDLAREGRTDAAGVPNLLQLAVLEAAYPDEIRLARPPVPVQRVLFAVLAPIARLLGYRA